MKTANFSHKCNSRTIFGTVTLKNDGKISISILDGKYYSAASRFQARQLAMQIVAADFNHPAAQNVKSDDDRKGLINLLTENTKELKDRYIKSVEDWASQKYDQCIIRVKWAHEKYMKVYGVIERNGHKYLSQAGCVAKSEANTICSRTKSEFIKKEKEAGIRHYENSLERLAIRLKDKGVTDNTKIEIINAWVGINLEMIIKHDGKITKAWTIIASGQIQRPHYRYLVK